MTREEVDPGPSRPARAWGACSALTLLCAAVHANGLDGPFVFDDIPQIVQSGALSPVWPGLDAFVHRQRTLTTLTFAGNHALGGFSTRGYHLVNVVIHLLAGLCLFGIVRRTLALERFAGRVRGRAVGLAWIVAALWLLHPLQTESVTYVVQRAEALMGLFYLATLYCTIRAATSPHAFAWQGLAVLACALGMGSKPVMVTAPIVVLLFDRLFLAGSWGAVFRRRGGLHAGLALGWLVLAASGLAGQLVDPAASDASGAGFGMKDVSARGYLLTQPRVLLHYLRLAFWPHPLVLDHGWPIEASLARALPAALVLLSVLAATIAALVRGSPLAFLGAWFFLVLAPTSSFVPLRDAAVEHRMYLPLAAVVTLAVLGGHALLQELTERASLPRALARGTAVACVALVILALGLRTRARNEDYRDGVVLWTRTVQYAPHNGRAYNLLAGTLTEAGRDEEGLEVLRRGLHALEARGVGPSDRVFRALTVNLASTLIRAGRQEEAVALLGDALARAPQDVQMVRQLGLALAGLGRHDEAVRAYREAIELAPADPVSHRELALVHRDRGDAGSALFEVEEARRLAPRDLESILLAANLLVESSDWVGAERAYRAALAQRAQDSALLVGLGFSLEKQDRLADAAATYEAVLALEPENAKAQYALGRCCERQGFGARALEHYQRAAELQPHKPWMAEALRRARSRP